MMADPGQICKVTVDGTDFRIEEQFPFSKKWFSFKFKGPGLRYEVAICIKTGWIVWINGPFPPGDWTDEMIAQEALIHNLDDEEMFCADRGYKSLKHSAKIPTGVNSLEQKSYSFARARHETVNRRFKEWQCLQQRFRHNINLHRSVFTAVANIVQIAIEHGRPPYRVHYDEDLFF